MARSDLKMALINSPHNKEARKLLQTLNASNMKERKVRTRTRLGVSLIKVRYTIIQIPVKRKRLVEKLSNESGSSQNNVISSWD